MQIQKIEKKLKKRGREDTGTVYGCKKNKKRRKIERQRKERSTRRPEHRSSSACRHPLLPPCTSRPLPPLNIAPIAAAAALAHHAHCRFSPLLSFLFPLLSSPFFPSLFSFLPLLFRFQCFTLLRAC